MSKPAYPLGSPVQHINHPHALRVVAIVEYGDAPLYDLCDRFGFMLKGVHQRVLSPMRVTRRDLRTVLNSKIEDILNGK